MRTICRKMARAMHSPNRQIADQIVRASFRPDYGEYDEQDLVRLITQALDAKERESKALTLF